MADLFKQYGIKEVADVTIYKLETKNGVTTETPFLFLDTLKVSTLEQTAEQSDARGGKGNPKLITWDYGKEINVTLEDALYSPASMALMWGGENGQWTETTSIITKGFRVDATATVGSKIKDGKGNEWTIQSLITGGSGMAVCTASVASKILTIGADDFPGTYKIVGDTYARNRDTGEDEYFQFIIERAKMSAEQTLTLEAEGDPTTFNLNLTVLRPTTGNMIKLVQYDFASGE